MVKLLKQQLILDSEHLYRIYGCMVTAVIHSIQTSPPPAKNVEKEEVTLQIANNITTNLVYLDTNYVVKLKLQFELSIKRVDGIVCQGSKIKRADYGL